MNNYENRNLSFLTITESVKHFSNIIKNKVIKEDIYQLYLDSIIDFYVNFPGYVNAINFNSIDSKYKTNSKDILPVRGVFKLLLTDASRNVIINKFNTSDSKNIIKSITIYGDGIIFEDINNNRIYQLLEFNQNVQFKTPCINLPNRCRSVGIDSDCSDYHRYSNIDLSLYSSNSYTAQTWRQAGSLPIDHNILISKKIIDDKFVISCINDLNSKKSYPVNGSFSFDNDKISDNNSRLVNEKLTKEEKIEKIRNGSSNYFILINDNWLVKFNGGKESILKNLVPVKILITYLRNKNKEIFPNDIYSMFCEDKIDDNNNSKFYDANFENNHNYNQDYEKENCNSFNVKNKNVNILSKESVETLEKNFKEILSEIIEYKNSNNFDKVEELQDTLNEQKKILRKIYSGVIINDDYKIIINKDYGEFKDRKKEYVKKYLKRAKKLIEEKYSKEFSDHIESSLINKNFIYSPIYDIEWDIID